MNSITCSFTVPIWNLDTSFILPCRSPPEATKLSPPLSDKAGALTISLDYSLGFPGLRLIPVHNFRYSSAERTFLKNKYDHCPFPLRVSQISKTWQTPSDLIYVPHLPPPHTGPFATLSRFSECGTICTTSHTSARLLPLGIALHWGCRTNLTHNLGSP